jgi:outer membrane lipoprotein carrier protein LolA
VRWSAFGPVCLSTLLWSTSAAALELDALMQALRAVPERHARFEETKRIALLEGPIVRRGTLDYARPDRLTMRVETPFFEKLEVAGDALTIERRSGTTRVALASQPQVAAWIESLRATLAGDRAGLTAHFDVALEGDASNWRMVLKPRDRTLAGVVARVEIAGRGADVLRFEMEEQKGDSSVVVIAPR